MGDILRILSKALTMVRLSTMLLNDNFITIPLDKSVVLNDFFMIKDCPRVDSEMT